MAYSGFTTIQSFQQSHLDQVANLIARSFTLNNQLWKSKKEDFQQIKQIVRIKCIPALYSGMSFVTLFYQILKYSNKIIGASIQIDIIDYFNSKNIQHSCQLFNIIEKYSKLSDDHINIQNNKRGDIIYGLYGVIDPDYSMKGLSFKFWWSQFAIGKLSGYKEYYARLTSDISNQLLIRMGGQLVAQYPIQQTGGNLYLRKVIIQNIPSYRQMIQKIYNNRNQRKNQAKL